MMIIIAVLLACIYIYCMIEYCKAKYADYIEQLENED